mmetsp:Transcript_75495/g.196831  ORF Transcript_75495/g.196831 Transcript_75495/m.196831 type:complete len:287 (+) Transcript_75495:104-964(+)
MSFQFFTSSQNGSITAPGPGGDRTRPRGEEKQTSLPVTIRSIENALQAEGEEVSFFGSQPELLILVAAIESVQKHPNNLDLVVSDATGRLRVRQFLSGDADDAQHEGVQAGRYVHMFGQVRAKPEPHFVAQGIRPVKTADEVSYHTIEAAHAALKLQRGPAAAAAPAQATPVKAQAPPGTELQAPALTPPKEPVAAGVPAAGLLSAAAASPPATVAHVLSGASLRAAMMEFLTKTAESNGDVGCSRSDVCVHFKTSSEVEVNGLLAEMVADGDAFTTIDDNHFTAV